DEGLAIAIANRMAVNKVNFFMVRIVPVTTGKWQARSDLFCNRFENLSCTPTLPDYRCEHNCLAKKDLCPKTRVHPPRAPKRLRRERSLRGSYEKLARERQWRKILR